jgi:outer membrane protein TolC
MNADVAWRKEAMKKFVPVPMNTPASVMAHRARVRAAQLEAERAEARGARRKARAGFLSRGCGFGMTS